MNPIYKIFNSLTGNETIIGCQYNALSNECIKLPNKADNSLSAKIKCIYNLKLTVEFHRCCLKQDTKAFDHRNGYNPFIAHELETWSKHLNTDFTLKKFVLVLGCESN